MISIAICIIIAGVVHIALEYLSSEYEVLESVAPWFGYIAIGLMALAAVFSLFQMILDIRRGGSHILQALICAGVAAAAYITILMLGQKYTYLSRYEDWALYLMIGYGAAVILQCIAQLIRMIRRESRSE